MIDITGLGSYITADILEGVLMRTINISVVALILSSFSLAQNWFPLEVGNKTLGRHSYEFNGGHYVDFYLISVERDSIINGEKYYYVINKAIIPYSNLFQTDWMKYNQLEQKLYVRFQDTVLLYMDFNIPDGGQYFVYNPIYGDSTYRTVFYSAYQLFGQTRNSRGFIPQSWLIREWIDGIGAKPVGTVIQSLQLNGDDTTYYEYGYEPDFSLFSPIVKTNELVFDYVFTIKHYYSHTFPPFTIDFIDSVYLDCFYKSDKDSIGAGRIYATNYYNVQRKAHFALQESLIKNGYSFYYNVTAKDKGLIPKYRTSPTTGYYKLIYDPSPIQILFSEDSIYVPTLSDSGSVKIINTSDHSVRIDSIVSVGSFYGYWGNFTKPGFQYPFYLFQTMPGFMGDTLGIIIPPRDSINVSFYDIDLCPICDYEVQDYFEDTLRFVFTFMDGNVYSFSKSIPISGEGHPSAVEDEEILPKQFSLEQNYPNPFNPSTTIIWQSPVSGWQTIKVYDVLGNEIATLVNEYQSAGNYEIQFDASRLANGIYYYQLRAGDYLETKKMILLK